jgi:site-specific DNA recombinase
MTATGYPIVRVVIYCRISDDNTGRALGVKRQEKDCRKICDDLPGWTVVAVFVDDDRSARELGEHREGYQRMLQYIRAGHADAVVVIRTDRLVRDHERRNDARDFLRFAMEHELKFANDGNVTFRWSAAARKRFLDEATEAEYESGVKSERLLDQHKQYAEQGKWAGGAPKYGWEYEPYTRSDRTVGMRWTGRLNEAAAEVVRDAARRALAGETLEAIADDFNTRPDFPSPAADRWTQRLLGRLLDSIPAGPEQAALKEDAAKLIDAGMEPKEIVRDWNSRGVRRLPPGRWSAPALRRMLLSPHTVGHRSHRGVVTKEDCYPAILDHVTYELLVAKLTDPARFKRGYGGRVSLLAGDHAEELAVCGACWDRMIGSRNDRGERVYRCRGCGRVSRLADRVEEFIRDVILCAHDSDEFRRALAGLASGDDTEAELHRRLAALDEREKLLRATAADPNIPFDEVDFATSKLDIDRQRREVRQELERLRRPISALTDFPQHGREMRDAWAAKDVHWRHRLVRIYLRRVVFLPVGRGNSDLGITVVWQDYLGDPAKAVAEAIAGAKAEGARPAKGHGYSRYSNDGCRCQVCVAAALEYGRRYRERNRERMNENAARWRERRRAAATKA